MLRDAFLRMAVVRVALSRESRLVSAVQESRYGSLPIRHPRSVVCLLSGSMPGADSAPSLNEAPSEMVIAATAKG
jgi:hypothetical protein